MDRVTADDVDTLAGSVFPLCMQAMQSALKERHKLKHLGRLQYGLFLKGVGLSMEDALLYWQREFTKGMSGEEFTKKVCVVCCLLACAQLQPNTHTRTRVAAAAWPAVCLQCTLQLRQGGQTRRLFAVLVRQGYHSRATRRRRGAWCVFTHFPSTLALVERGGATTHTSSPATATLLVQAARSRTGTSPACAAP